MIYLITGTPGTGKTSFVLHMWLKNKNKIFTFEDGTPRPLYYNHIDGLDARALKAHELQDDELMSAPLIELMPEGAVLIVDEADYIYPVRGLKAPPLYVQTLKELRHYGFTLILITQNASMLDSYVRRLISTHWHLQRRPLGTKLYEFNQCQESLSESSLKLAASSIYKPDSNTFKLYKSASVHFKHKKKLHKVFYIFPVLLILTIYFFIKALAPVNKIYSDKSAPASASKDNRIESVDSGHDALAKPLNINSNINKSNSLVGIKALDFIPRLPDHPESAPIYDSLRKPVNIELVVGCVKNGKSCNCYSNQATLIKVSYSFCQSFLDGRRFDAYRMRSSVQNNLNSNENKNQLLTN